MKKLLWLTGCFVFVSLSACSQATTKRKANPVTVNNNTLLWRISGNNLKNPSYLFGTMHMLCADDIYLSDSLKTAIKKADQIYLELDMNNLVEMMGAMSKMKMRNDTTLADLLTPEEYKKVKEFFESGSSLFPFSMIETYKPLLASSMVVQMQSFDCDNVISIEEMVMKEAKSSDVGIKGLETMGYQLSIFDSIPYAFQAKQLLKMIESGDKEGDDVKEVTDAYRNQQLEKMEELTKREDMGIEQFTDLLLYRRNQNWAGKLHELMPSKTLVVAVGAGHLPGELGVINLLRKMGYKVEPVENNMIRKKVKEI